MKNALALVVVAGLASSAFATSTVSILSSVNGGAFAATNNVNAGDTVRVRVEVSTSLAMLGLSGVTYNLTATNFSDSSLSPWSASLGSADTAQGPGVQDLVNGNGRLAPFAASGATANPTSSLAAGVLTIGGGGTGGRIATGQNPQTLSNNGFGNYFHAGTSGVAIFQFSFTVGSAYNLGDTIGLAMTNVLNEGTNGVRWYASTASTSTNDPNPIKNEGRLTFVPTPGALALLGLGGLVAGRRRR